MNKEKDFFKTCFNTVAGLEVKNESQAIAKEVVLNEVENLQQENKQLKDNWNKLKEWASNFYNSEEVGWAGCGMRYTLEKILELENETANNCNDCKQCKGSDNNG